tara:strand:+ start:19578 stop:20336 length:759 start_codon:yes stop_codon:yes gene_type:complete
MALTLNKLVYDVKNIAYGGYASDDAKIGDKQIAYWIMNERSMILSQIMGKKMRVAASCIETLERVFLKPVDESEACEIDLGTHVLKSVKPIPRTIQRNDRDSILAVESLDGQRAFSETTAFRKKWNKYNKYTSSKNRWYIKDNHLYVICDMLIDAVKLTGVFEDAEEVWLHNRCLEEMGGVIPGSGDDDNKPDYESCEYSWDEPFPISMTMAENVTTIVLQKRMQITLALPNDETNNAKGDGEQNMQVPASK